jgi:CheY-like chemotaxis protein
MSRFHSPRTTLERSILVVDDMPDNCYLLQTLLESEGHHVDVAEDGYTAIAKVEANPPDLVLLDMMMPGLNGQEVANYLRQDSRLAIIPILMITGWHELSTSQELLNVDGILYKPLDIDELLVRVEALLQLSQAKPISQINSAKDLRRSQPSQHVSL